MAVNEGKRFEHEVADSVPDNIWFYRIPDNATSFGGGMGSRFTSDSRYDCLMWDVNTKQLHGFELKSNKSTAFSFPDRKAVAEYTEMVNDLAWYKDKKKKKTDDYTKAMAKRKEYNIKQARKKLNQHDIKWHQIDNLSKDQEFGLKCGFLFQFRGTDHAYYLSIVKFMKFWTNTPKKSINENDVIEYGGFLIANEKKKVTHVYDIGSVIDYMKEEKYGSN